MNLKKFLLVVMSAGLVVLSLSVPTLARQGKEDTLPEVKEMQAKLDRLAQIRQYVYDEKQLLAKQSDTSPVVTATTQNFTYKDTATTSSIVEKPVTVSPVYREESVPPVTPAVLNRTDQNATAITTYSVDATDIKKVQSNETTPLVEENDSENVTKDNPVLVEAVVPATTTPVTESKAVTTKEENKAGALTEENIRKQSVETLQKTLKINDAIAEARSITLPVIQGAVVVEEKNAPIMTPSDTIRDVLTPEVAQKKIDLDFAEISLGDIVMTMSKMAGINLVIDPALKNNKIDLHLKNVSIEEALLLMANSYELGFKRVGDSLFITDYKKLRSQNIASRLFKLRNIEVEGILPFVKDLAEQITACHEINSLLVVGDPEEILQIAEIVKKIDKPQPQVILEAKIIEINKDALRDLGVDWSDQVHLSYQEAGRPVDFANVEDAPDSAAKIFAISRNPIQFDTVIRMLESQNKAKVLSSPRVTTLNDRPAEIFVGDQIPYTITNVTGGVVTTDVRWVEPGIRLNITPSIIDNEFVAIKVEPEVSFIFAFRGPNDEFPQVKTRQATAYVRVKNNEPFVLGGLLSQEDKNNLFKVPVLGNIPLLGNLFTYEKRSVQDTELIITIIPTIVPGE